MRHLQRRRYHICKYIAVEIETPVRMQRSVSPSKAVMKSIESGINQIARQDIAYLIGCCQHCHVLRTLLHSVGILLGVVGWASSSDLRRK